MSLGARALSLVRTAVLPLMMRENVGLKPCIKRPRIDTNGRDDSK